MMSLMRRACGEDFETISTKSKKEEQKNLNLLTQFFLAYFGHFLIELSHTNGHINETQSPRLWYCIWEATTNWIFLSVEEKGRWKCRYEASRPSLSRDLACGRPPAQQTPHCNTPHNVKIFCKIKRREDGRVATCNGALDEISARMGSVAELAANIISSTGYVPLVPHGTAGCGALQA